MFGNRPGCRGLAGFVGCRFASMWQVELAAHYYSPIVRRGRGEGPRNLSAARRRRRACPSGPEIIRPPQTFEGLSTCGRFWIIARKGSQRLPFPASGAFAPPVQGVIITDRFAIRR